MKKLASVLVLLAVAGAGRADDEAVIAELIDAGVRFSDELSIVYFDGVRGTDALVGRLADLKRRANMRVDLRGSDLTDVGLAAIGCRFEAVHVLLLNGTAVTDAGLKNLVGVRVLGAWTSGIVPV